MTEFAIVAVVDSYGDSIPVDSVMPSQDIHSK